MISISAFAINLSFMELCQSETRLAGDAAAKAAVAALGVTQSQDRARAEAQRVAQLHRVAGRNFSLSNSEIEFGNCSTGNNGELTFVRDRTPINSVRVNCGDGASESLTFFCLGSSAFRSLRSQHALITMSVSLLIEVLRWHGIFPTWSSVILRNRRAKVGCKITLPNPTQMAADGEQCRMRSVFSIPLFRTRILKLAWLHLAANSSLVCLSRVVQRRMSTFIELARDLRSTGSDRSRTHHRRYQHRGWSERRCAFAS